MQICKDDFNQKIACYIKREKERMLKDWVDLVAQPSISATGEGVEECCRMVVVKMKSIGLSVNTYPAKPYPVIYGKYGDDPDKKTILIYAHYDVQPVGNMELWKTMPFEPVILDGAVYGRGTADNKSPLMAHLEAVEFWIKEYGELPVNLKFIFEGCEESGSKGLPEFLDEYRDMLAADLVFFSDGPKNEKNLPIIALGAKGLLSIQLVLKTISKDAHSRYAPVLPSAAWEMVELLHKLKSDGQVHVPGFYDHILQPTEQEIQIMNALPNVEKEMEQLFGVVPRYPDDSSYYVQLNTTPTFNVSFLHSGDGAGVVTNKAVANLDIRLVMGQMPDDIFNKIQKYIRVLGYDNVEVIKESAVEPSKTPLDNKYVPIIEEVTKEVYGDYVVYSCRPSTAPDYLWTNILRLPAIQVRWSDADSNNHAPNEHLTIKEYLKGIELTCRVIKAIGEEKK
ncbi:acetylornithine deacetylase/succinyl-diaminopimelate desuccinylase-like protein [Sporomusaceae bacterium BoRhaA]|uniref:M20/M25/M40 family metallo-hydrolase n=1 Tax=Pelorhabdus rhamnosifermentans TaxID=2772457 RepID=UPI001C060474|nr:M20/M25/M40 family metallo-hydrolase [Pelorhabdus rhamnosifermentans]MBU2699445.1 acetylornithine deacetylase/succinyl-diaminopimelate desuccinylase-like protein [Pelorhabdus rhamnosifermentans]